VGGLVSDRYRLGDRPTCTAVYLLLFAGLLGVGVLLVTVFQWVRALW
jgi:hypothetical protein